MRMPQIYVSFFPHFMSLKRDVKKCSNDSNFPISFAIFGHNELSIKVRSSYLDYKSEIHLCDRPLFSVGEHKF